MTLRGALEGTPRYGDEPNETDVEALRRSLDKLQQSERRINLALRASNAAIWEFDAITGKVAVHGSLKDVFDRRPGPLPGGRDLLHHIHPDDRRMAAGLLAESAINGEPRVLKCRLDRADGQERWVQLVFEAIVDTNGMRTGSRGIVSDISSAVQTETQLRDRTATLEAERKKFHDLLETTSDWYWETDANLRIISVSDNFAHSTELSRTQILGACLADFEKSDQHPQLTDEWRDHLRARQDVRNMYVMIEADGRRFYLRIAGRPVHAPDGAFVGYRGTASDITVGLARSHDVHQGQKLQALGTMAAGLAHEFNNILAIVLGYAASLRDEFRNDASATRQLEEIIDAGNRGANLARSLLSFGRGKHTPTRETLNVHALVTELPKLLKPLLGPGIELRIDGGKAPTWVKADSSMLTQSIVNLVVNARDATTKGGVITIRLAREPRNSDRIRRRGLHPDQDYVVISVSDTGIGMDRQVLDRLFEPFFTTKAVGQGTGLGLSLVFSFLKDHDGAVDVDSTPNVGTTFSLLLPLSAAQSGTIATALHTRERSFAGLNALVLDDEPQLLALYEKMLRNVGMNVIAQTDLDAALALVDDDRYNLDLLVSDVLMPKMSGFRFAELATSLRPDLKVLFVTGQPERAAEDNQIPDGANILRKPFTQDQLSTSVANALRSSTSS